jgi:hypothetical protein
VFKVCKRETIHYLRIAMGFRLTFFVTALLILAACSGTGGYNRSYIISNSDAAESTSDDADPS